LILVCRAMKELSFSRLMRIYREACLERGTELAPELSEESRILLGEDAFYEYLQSSFFRHPGAQYLILQKEDDYVSALRLEPWQDGLLLEALETAPQLRCRGYASELLREVCDRYPGPVYSHVVRHNKASLAVHQRCGFQIASRSARMLDGTVTDRIYTLVWQKK